MVETNQKTPETLEEFQNEFYQEILRTAEAENVYSEDAFFDIVNDYLIEAGEFSEANRAHYHPQRIGIRVDGYCGDPLENKESPDLDWGVLSLIILDFVQGGELATLTNSDMESDFKRVQKYLINSLDEKFRDSLEVTDPGFGLADLIFQRWEKIGKIKIFLLTNKVLSNRVDGKEADDLGKKQVFYSVWDLSRLQKLIQSGEEREKLEVDFTQLPGGPMKALLASKEGSKNKVYLAAVSGGDLAAIYDRWGTRLLEQNVRVFLQARSNVNKGIRRTLENEPERFFSFNNGITATAEAVECKEKDSGLFITKLENLQIVNGGQTTASIYAAYKNKKDLSKVFVQMKLVVVGQEEARDLVPRISENANSQNKVSAADFFANHPFHTRIEDFSRRILAPAAEGSFHQTKWFYERARGQYRDAQAYLTPAKKREFQSEYPKKQVFTKTDLAKYLMVWTDRAYFVNRGAQKNFAEFAKDIDRDWDKNENRFNEYYFKCLVAKKIVFNAAERVVSERSWYEAGGYRSQHAVLAVGCLAEGARQTGKEVDFLSIWQKQAVSKAFENALGQAADIAHEVLMDPASGYRNISEWAKQQACWTRVKAKKVSWSPTWVAELEDRSEIKEAQWEGVKDQKELSGIDAQTQVVDAGAEFWAKMLDWCLKESEGTEKERGIMKIATRIPASIPTDKQSIVLVQMMARLRKGGCPYRLKRTRRL